MEKEFYFWYTRKEDEDCLDLFRSYVYPHLAEHQTLKEIRISQTKCEFILKSFPLNKKKNDLKK